MATDAADYTLQQTNIDGFTQAFFLEKFGTANCGLVELRSDARFGKGNVWQVRGRTRDLTALQDVPAVGSDLTINDITQYIENGVVARRYQVYGIQDMSAVAAGDETALRDYAQLIDHNVRYGLNQIIHTYMLPALFNTTTTSVLNGTHFIDTNGAALEPYRVQEALRVWGEHGNTADGILMHSYVNSKLKETGLVEEGTEDLIRELETQGVRYGGRLSGIPIFIDDMCYAASSGNAGVYNSYVFKRNALLVGYDGELIKTVIGRDELKGGGIDYIKANLAFSPHCYGVSSQLSPTVASGATTTELGTVTSYAKRTGVTSPEIGIVCIQSTEV